MLSECRETDSNRYGTVVPRDFKSVEPEGRNPESGAAPLISYHKVAADTTRSGTNSDTAQLPLELRPAERREAAQQSALGKLPLGVREALEGAVRALPVGAVFTAESLRGELSFAVRDVLSARTENGRAMRYANGLGALFVNMAKRGEIEPAGYCEAQREAARGRVIRRWRRTGRAA